MGGKFTIKPLKELMARRKLEPGGATQKFIDNEVMKLSAPYTPFDTGNLSRSAIRHTQVGQGEVKWQTPYARRLYYNTGYNYQGAPQRGGQWFERMKSQHKVQILQGAAKIAGAKHE